MVRLIVPDGEEEFQWYDKYHVFKEKEAHNALTGDEYEKLKKLIAKIYSQRENDTSENGRRYVVVSNKEKKLFKVAKLLVESFSVGR